MSHLQTYELELKITARHRMVIVAPDKETACNLVDEQFDPCDLDDWDIDVMTCTDISDECYPE